MVSEHKLRITLGSFDLIKGIGMIGIVLGHMSYNYDWASMPLLWIIMIPLKMLLNGLMPMFLIASGYGMKKRNWKKMMTRSFSETIVPYLYVFGITSFLFTLVHYWNFNWWPGALHEATRYFFTFSLGLAEPGKVVFGYATYEILGAWFLLALFVATNVTNLILHVKEISVQVLLCGVSIFAGYMLHTVEFNYFCIPQGLMAVGCLYMGYLLKQYRIFNRGKELRRFWATPILISVVQMLFGELSMAYGAYKYGLLGYFGACVTGMVLLYAGVWLGQIEWKPLNWIRNVGVHTYWLMCIHVIETITIPWYRMQELQMLNPYVRFALEAGLRIAILTSGCLLMKRITKWKYRRRMANGKEKLCP